MMKNNDDMPIQYKNGWVEFYKLKFKVTTDVLIPRPETELLVDEVLKFINSSSFILTILDIGTGSGNIAISLACNLSGCNVKIVATDVSQEALNIARLNAKFHGVENKIKFVHSNLLKNHPLFPINPRSEASRSLIIVTNLPYIPSARIPYLDPSVKDFEPHLALDGGEDGFELYRKLFQQINHKVLNPKLIIGEVDYTHGKLAYQEALKYFPNAQVEVKTDLAHKQRILTIRNI